MVTKPRARDLGIPFAGRPGPLNAITDVAGVAVGHTTLISGHGEVAAGRAVRTGVTAILPRGAESTAPVFAGWFPLNGNGEMTGTAWVEESGFLEGPLMLTNTHSVGTVRDAVIAWQVQMDRRPPLNRHGDLFWSLPVVAETWDGYLNDINGFHVNAEHVFQALAGARGAAVAEGNVGGGTGMILYGFKGGIGTASRESATDAGAYTLGVLAQCNFGRRGQLLVAGVPVGLEIAVPAPAAQPESTTESGSAIVVIATDAPLLPHQLKRLARRAGLGLARTGSTSGNGSGDLVIAFSTANPAAGSVPVAEVAMLSNQAMDPLFEATVQATDEAVINALVAAETMIGVGGRTVIAIPHDRIREALKKYNRLVEPSTE